METTARSLGVTFKRDGRFIYLSGYIDEFADYSALVVSEPPLRLVLRDILSINSQGINRWLGFIKACGLRAIEFHECPPVFIDATNMIPDMVSNNFNMKRIKSVLVPHHCRNCQKDISVKIEIEKVTVENDSCSVPSEYCARCGATLILGIDPDDHFLFLTAGV